MCSHLTLKVCENVKHLFEFFPHLKHILLSDAALFQVVTSPLSHPIPTILLCHTNPLHVLLHYIHQSFVLLGGILRVIELNFIGKLIPVMVGNIIAGLATHFDIDAYTFLHVTIPTELQITYSQILLFTPSLHKAVSICYPAARTVL